MRWDVLRLSVFKYDWCERKNHKNRLIRNTLLTYNLHLSLIFINTKKINHNIIEKYVQGNTDFFFKENLFIFALRHCNTGHWWHSQSVAKKHRWEQERHLKRCRQKAKKLRPIVMYHSYGQVLLHQSISNRPCCRKSACCIRFDTYIQAIISIGFILCSVNYENISRKEKWIDRKNYFTWICA